MTESPPVAYGHGPDLIVVGFYFLSLSLLEAVDLFVRPGSDSKDGEPNGRSLLCRQGFFVHFFCAFRLSFPA